MRTTLYDVDRSLTVVAASLLALNAGAMGLSLRALQSHADVPALVYAAISLLAGASVLRLLQPAGEDS